MMKKINTPINDLKLVLDTIQSGIISIDKDKFLIFFNDKAKRIFSLSEAFIGKPISGIVRNLKILNFIEQSLKAVENHNEIKTFEEDFFIDAAQSFDAKVSFLKVETSAKPKYLIVFNDISSITQSQKSQREFIENVSHELRTPITSILAATETIPTETPFRDIIIRQSLRMNEIIDDLLQLSVLENNSDFNIHKEEISLSDLILFSVETVQHLADKKNIDIEQPKDFNCCNLKVDISLIQNALSNILKNAIMYSNQNSKINIILSSQKDSCIIEIIDNGKGIKKENIKNIFNRFFREESSRSRDYGGLGLGLPIVKKILDLHNGDITIDSDIDKGTSVKIFLPIQT